MNQIAKGLRGPQSQLFYVLLTTAPQPFDKIFFNNDSELDKSIITGITANTNSTPLLPSEDFAQSIDINGVTFNTPGLSDLNNFTITLVNKKRQQVLSQFPLFLFNTITRMGLAGLGISQGNPKRTMNLEFSILTGECYIQVINTAFFLPVPIAIPIEVFYKYNG